MGYGNLPGVKANYIDGAFFNQPGSGQPRIVILGVAEKGDSYKLFRVFNQNEAVREFGEKGEMIARMYEAFDMGADNVFLMRIGGTTSKLVVEDSNSGTLTVTTTQTGDDSGDRFSLFLTAYDPGSGTDEQRILIYDNEDQSYVYDSHELAVVNDGRFVVKLNDWDDVFSVGDDTNGNPDAANEAAFLTLNLWGAFDGTSNNPLESAGTTSFTGAPNGHTLSTTTLTLGDDGMDANTGYCTLSNPEKYICLEKAYSILDYQYCDFIIPCDVFLDAPNIVDMDNGSDPAATTGSALYDPDWSTVPSAYDGDNDILGYFWKYRRGSRTYYAMSKVKNLNDQVLSGSFDVNDGVNTATVTGLVTDSTIKGIDNEPIAIDIASATTGASYDSATRTLTISIHSSQATSSDVESALQGIGTTVTGFDFSSVSVGSGISGAIQPAAAAGSLTITQYYLSHEQLTGETISTVALEKLGEATSAQFREINFAHQLATFCHNASTNWKTLIGLISTSNRATKRHDNIDPGLKFSYTDADDINEWAGEKPTYITIGGKLALDNIDDNGTGVLGNKFIAGAVGYRYRELEGGTTSDGLAYGGLILTKGLSLPNSGEPYGVDQSDEASDSNGFKIDLGKYVMITSAWPKLTTDYNEGTPYNAPITAFLAGRLATIPEHQAPIGPVNGAIGSGVSHWNNYGLSSHIGNELIQCRYTTLASRTINQSPSYYFAGCRTAATPDSDYTRITTIRCVNRILQGIRDIGEQYIGNSFTSMNLISLQTALGGYLKAEEIEGIHQGAAFQLSYTRADRIMGRLNVKLKMIPPFSIEAIVVDVTLASDESGLS